MSFNCECLFQFNVFLKISSCQFFDTADISINHDAKTATQ